jgi:hypothetical protein
MHQVLNPTIQLNVTSASMPSKTQRNAIETTLPNRKLPPNQHGKDGDPRTPHRIIQQIKDQAQMTTHMCQYPLRARYRQSLHRI